MAVITTVCNHKGGCAKSTTCLYLLAGLHRDGYKTLLIDLDERETITNKMTSGEGPTIVEVLAGEAKAAEAIQEAKFCDIIPAGAKLSAPDIIFGNSPTPQFRLKKALKDVVSNYDHILIDTPGGVNILTYNALTASNKVIIPTIGDEDSITGIYSMLSLIEDIKEFTNPDLIVSGILLSGYNRNTVFGRAMLDNISRIAEENNLHLYHPIRQSVEIQAAKFSAGETTILDSVRNKEIKKEINDFISDFIGG